MEARAVLLVSITSRHFNMLRRTWILLLIVKTLLAFESSCPDMCVCEDSKKEMQCEETQLRDILCSVHWNPKALTISNSSNIILKEVKGEICFTEIQHLHILNCDEVQIHPNAFLGFRYLYWIEVSRNSLLSLDINVFKGLHGLEVLYLEDNAMSYLESGIFNGLTQLSILSLSNNHISDIENGVFLPLKRLNQLRLNSNALVKINPEYFSGLVRLNKLHLNENKLQVLQSNSFTNVCNNSCLRSKEIVPLHNLQVLYLNDNNITGVEKGVFQGLQKLAYLNMNGNQLRILRQGMFVGLRKLSVLRIDYCAIVQIFTGAFRDLYKLHELYMIGNELVSITQDMFEGLSQLVVLDVSKNKISKLEASAFKALSKLKVLNLNNNKLSILDPNAIKDLTVAEKLFVSRNFIRELHNNAFECLYNLKVLNLDNNEVHIIHNEVFVHLKSLQKLSLRNNNMTSLTNDTSISFYNPEIYRKPSIHLKGLTHLDLYGNCFEKLYINVFQNVPKLSFLNVGKNRLSYLSEKVFTGVRNLKELILHDNPLKCDCDLHKTWKWLKNNHVNTSSNGEPLCKIENSDWNDVFSKLKCDGYEQKLSLLEQIGLFMIGPAAIIVIGFISWGYSKVRRKSHPI